MKKYDSSRRSLLSRNRRSTNFPYLRTILYRDIDTYIRMSTHFERCVYLRLPLESVNPVFQRISTVYIDIWLRFPARSKSLFGRSSPLLLRPALLPNSPPPRFALHCNYTKRRVTTPVSNVK